MALNRPVAVPSGDAAGDLVRRLDVSPLTGRHYGLYILVIVGHMFDGYGISMIGYAMAGIIGFYHITPEAAGFMASAGFVGMVLGAVGVGPLTDRIGRKKALMLAIGVFAVFSILCALASTFTALLWFRALQGLGLGMEIPVTGTYVSEFMPTRYRGALVTFATFFWSGATILAGVLGAALVPHYGWQSLFWVGAIPALVVLAMWAFIPESVRFLLKQGRTSEAQRIVGWLSPVPAAAAAPGGGRAAGAEVFDTAVERSSLRRIFTGRYTRLTVGIWAIEFIAGIVLFGLSSWLPDVFLNMGFTLVHSFLFTAAITGAGAIGSVVGGLVINAIGYRPSLIWGHLLGGVLLILWAFATGATSVVLLGAAAALFGVGAGGVAFAYLTSLYPTGARGTGIAWGGVWQRGGGVVAPAVIGILITMHVSSITFFVAMGVLWLINALIAATMTHEVKGKTLEQIDRELAG